MKYDYPSLQEIIFMHQILLKEFGGADGLRDIGALDSGLMRPQLGYYKNIEEQSAALMESLANNHPFVDGNKRIAFFTTDTFLRMNGKYIDCDNKLAYEFFISLFEKHQFDFANLLPWLKEHIRDL